MYRLTTLRIAPGLWTRRALTTWKTSTTPSVLHLSMVVAMAQNIPDLLTVSLQTHTHTHTIYELLIFTVEKPAVDQDGFVAGPNLHFNDLINDISHSLDV